MNWEAIGAIGELVGAIGVLATLLYLAVQIRQNTLLLKRSMQQSYAQNLQNQFVLLQDEFNRKAVLKSFQTDEEITLEESAAAEAFLIGAMASFQAQYGDYRLGLIDDDEWQRVRRTIANYFTTSWPRAWIAEITPMMDDEFSNEILDILEASPMSGSHLPSVLVRAKAIRDAAG